jgi:hypothetical protein
MDQIFKCDACPEQYGATPAQAAAPTAVEFTGDVLKWTFVPQEEPVHLVALFRDPGIEAERNVETVLDLRKDKNGYVRAGTNCWVRPLLRALGILPAGLRIALDNGVRCPCPKRAGCSKYAYAQRVASCLRATAPWLERLRHPDGGLPGVLLCDKDLVCVLAYLGRLTRDDGSAWFPPDKFIDALGQHVRYLGRPAIVCPHPIMLSRRHGKVYCQRIQETELSSSILALAKLSGDTSARTGPPLV